MAKDPVCGQEIDEDQAKSRTGQTLHGASEVDPRQGTRIFHNGQWYYFCGLECRSKFMTGPETYIAQAGA